jgi:uncharacterized membrane protein YbaN (DUF454 family)
MAQKGRGRERLARGLFEKPYVGKLLRKFEAHRACILQKEEWE